MMGGGPHLVRRFLGSLRPGGPSATARAWVESVLSDEEYRLWSRQAGPDRRHGVAVAREVERRLGVLATPPVLAAEPTSIPGLLEVVRSARSTWSKRRRIMARRRASDWDVDRWFVSATR